ncbi:hypothetical protein [Bradyrhizobium sp. TM239]|uniref:hypothetical protein n=1 Tax=Bradyrhizobium sp. TM239 TaxID=2599802 RepID=UPI0027D4AE58|nr:hypothetical protein TM239_41170 [Bradyrhizobium sp. TM239]
MLNSIHLFLDILEWRQTIRDEKQKRYHGRGLSLTALATNVHDIQLINMPERLRELQFHLTVHEGTARVANGEPFEDGIGVMVLHPSEPARDDLPAIDAMVSGWFFLQADLYHDVWQQVSADNYSSARLSLYAGPFGFDVMEWIWDYKKNPGLNIEEASFEFVRNKRAIQPPPLKKSLFG